MEGGGGREQNYWPGFVDVLSNVVLTLVFVLVVFVIALSLSANKVEKKLQEVIEQKKKIEEQSKTPPPKSAAAVMNENIEVDSAQASKFMDELSRTEANIVKNPGKLTIHYPTAGVDLDDASSKKLAQALEEVVKKAPNQKVVINAYLGNESYSAAQRLAYYRALYVRKFLIEHGVTTGESIHGRILQPNHAAEENKNSGYVEILLEGSN